MIIGIPKEIKTKETRVAVTPSGVQKLVPAGHQILVQESAGLASGFSDEAYTEAGAKLTKQAKAVWEQSELVVKVKEPIESEYPSLHPGLTIFTFLHLASVPSLVDVLGQSRVTAIGYETVELKDGFLPLLTPMSEVAGKIATQIGTYLLHTNHGGKGLLLGGVTGTKKGLVVVIGGGHVGLNAAAVALGLGSEVVVLDVKDHKLKGVEERFHGKVRAIRSSEQSAAEWTQKADLVVGAVLVSGDKAPQVMSKEMVTAMEAGSVIVDVAIDQGGCIETSHPTTHAEPTYKERGVTHYCVTNMPALTPRTSTEALTRATLPYVLKLANLGIAKALETDPALRCGLQTQNGKAVHPAIKKLFPRWA